MKRSIKSIYNSNKVWWDSFTSCFVGTLLGIVITFGVSYLNTRSENRKTERKIQLITVNKIEQALNHIEERVETLKQSDSVFIAVHDYWDRDRLDEIPEDLIAAFYESLMRINFQTEGNTAIDMFRSNVEIWKTMDPLSIDAMESLLDIIQLSYDMISKVESDIATVRSNIMKEHFITRLDTPAEVTGAFFSDPENTNLMIFANLNISILDSFVPHFKNMFKELKVYLDITEQDMENLYGAEIYEEYSIKNDSL